LWLEFWKEKSRYAKLKGKPLSIKQAGEMWQSLLQGQKLSSENQSAVSDKQPQVKSEPIKIEVAALKPSSYVLMPQKAQKAKSIFL
jgi:hypothetical protein